MLYDTIIIGGGIGGLQTAIQLGRSLRSVLVIDQKKGRSVIAKNYRNILGYPEGISGEELRSTGEKQARGFGVEFLFGTAEQLTQNEDRLFQVHVRDHQQPFRSKTIVLATGISDPFPSIPGLEACLGESIFICPDCDGYEVIDRKTIVIGSGQEAVAMAKTLQYFTEQLVVVNHTKTALPLSSLDALVQNHIPYYEDEVIFIAAENGSFQKAILQSGIELEGEKGFLAFAGAQAKTNLLRDFSVPLIKSSHIQVDPRTQETAIPGIWAVGDIVPHAQQVTVALGDGSKAAIWIHKRLG